ncbi:MAG TPA: cytochrome P450, partial [Acidimicrobiales bacterium]|nr:cytochrome P450 [Acidimicrobiales bacterium]
MTRTSPELALNDPTFYTSDRSDTYRLLRDHFPIYWCRTGGFWAISRYEDVLSVSRDPQTFCNGQGMTMRGGELDDVRGGETLITTDAPKHTYQRRLVNRSFSQRAVASLEPRIRGIARGLVDAAPEHTPIDFVSEIAALLPVIVIAELLGIPTEDQEKFVAWSNCSIGAADPEYADVRMEAMSEMYAYFESELAGRRFEPRDDLLTVIAGAEDEGGPDFNHLDAMSLCFLLLAAGNETTRNLVSHSVIALSRNPDQLEKLRDGADMQVAVEELLRFTSPVVHMARTVTVETEICGQALEIGDQIVMLYGAANKDERTFGATAEDLIVDRDPNPHLTFGFGPHFCLGAALA